MIDPVALITSILAAIILYPQIRRGIADIKNDIKALIEELRRRRR